MTVFDKTIRPQDDFFGHVNNHWLEHNPIPPTKSVWGSFYVLRNKSALAVRKIVKNLATVDDNSLSHDQRLIKTFFTAAESYTQFAPAHLETLCLELAKISAIKDASQLAHYLGYTSRHNFGPFWSTHVSVDDKNSSTQVLSFQQDGLTLPNRDYYLDNSATMKSIREKYEAFFHSVNQKLPSAFYCDWDVVSGIEHTLAMGSWTDVELRDVESNYTRFTLAGLQSDFPAFDWTAYFKGLGWENPSDNIVIGQIPFINTSLDILNNQPLDHVKQYLTWHMVTYFLGWIRKDLTELNFNFFGRVLDGKKAAEPTWKRVVALSDRLIIGEVLGRDYAKQCFPESSKQEVLDMVEDIRTAYHARIDRVNWMSKATKEIAHKKLDNMRVLIGYPADWPDLSQLKLHPDNHLANILAVTGFDTAQDLKRIGTPPNPDKWYMNAQTVNAYHDPNQLIICFPAGILQPPFYNPKASRATNLGGIGAVIGHEFTHGFDDQGSQFDEYGNVAQWQSDTDIAGFKKQAHKMILQADSFEVLPDVFLKGELVIGETIADIGGLELAIEALRKNPGISKSALRSLFTNFARAECGAQREEVLLQMAKIDPHPPSKFRVNYVVKQSDAFYDTYDVKPSDSLYLPPEERTRIW